jgi:hypothetical protein
MYEKKHQPLAPLPVFFKRVLKNMAAASLILAICLVIGIVGFRYTAGAAWIDALHNASMLLSGMGPVIAINSVTGKLFSSFYALFSGVVFITNIGVILAPLMHRIIHRFHLDEE